MGRLSPLIPLAVFSALSLPYLAACEEKAKPTSAPRERSQGVEAVGTAATTAQAVATATQAPAAEPAPHAVLCGTQLEHTSKDAPKAALSHAGKLSLGDKLPVGEGHWTWVNLWAAWCVPCKEEIPRLKSWEQKTAAERTTLKVAFVSMDDDARQLEKFLGSQPESGLTSTYWLKDGPERAAWLKEAGFATDPELPAHVLIDPSGKIRCKQQGAIDDTDFPEVLKILRGERGAEAPVLKTSVPAPKHARK